MTGALNIEVFPTIRSRWDHFCARSCWKHLYKEEPSPSPKPDSPGVSGVALAEPVLIFTAVVVWMGGYNYSLFPTCVWYLLIFVEVLVFKLQTCTVTVQLSSIFCVWAGCSGLIHWIFFTPPARCSDHPHNRHSAAILQTRGMLSLEGGDRLYLLCHAGPINKLRTDLFF